MPPNEQPKRHWLARGLIATALLAFGAAVSWGVTHLLDAGAKKVRKPSDGVDVSVQTDLAKAYANTPPWQTYNFVTESNRLGVPPSRLCRTWQRWAVQNGGVDADRTVVFVTLQGREGKAVSVESVDVDVVGRNPPVRGVSGHCQAGGAVGSPRKLDIDLDDRPASVRFGELGDDFPARSRLTITLNGTETETLELTAHTRTCDCRWRARLHLLVGGEERELVVDDHGEPFRTSSSGAARHLTRDGGRWVTMSRADWRHTLPVRWAHLQLG